MKRALLVLLALVLVASFGLPAFAQTSTDVNTRAVVTGAGTGPGVEAKWEFSTYITTLGPDPGQINITPNTTGAVPGVGASTQIRVCAVVTDTNGIGDITGVYYKIFNPDGTEKVQVHMEQITTAAAIDERLGWAVSAGQMTAARRDQLRTMIEKNAATLWCYPFTYETHQPCGRYMTRVTVVDRAGNTGSLENRNLNIECVRVLAADFSAVDYGQIVPNSAKWVMGNDVFSVGDGLPTLWNQGNIGAAVIVRSSPMVGVSEQKTITEFDAQLLGAKSTYLANTDLRLPGPLLPCTPTQIDFSIHPPTFLPVDTYTGTLDIWLVAP